MVTETGVVLELMEPTGSNLPGVQICDRTIGEANDRDSRVPPLCTGDGVCGVVRDVPRGVVVLRHATARLSRSTPGLSDASTVAEMFGV